MGRQLKRICLVVLLVLSFGQAHGKFSLSEVAEGSFSPDCLDYEVIGICLKLVCTPVGCTINTVPWIEHRLPDVVVSAYNNPGDIAWEEAAGLYGDMLEGIVSALMSEYTGFDLFSGGFSALDAKAGVDSDRPPQTNNLKYKEISVIGNPVISEVFGYMEESGMYVCGTEVSGMTPYFQSEADGIAWRTGLTEQLYVETWAPFMRPVGLFPFGMWGGVYPRQGFLHQHYDSIAAAVMAQRAIDIATRSAQPHIYTQIPDIAESWERSDAWSMIHPVVNNECISFGDPDESDYFEGRENNGQDLEDEGNYGWLYWAKHDCCPGAGVTIAKIPAVGGDEDNY